MTGLNAVVCALADEFPEFEFGIVPTWHGYSLAAARRNRNGPGVILVITLDPSEMRAALTAAS